MFCVMQHIYKQYASQVILRDFTLAITQGDFVSLLGPSGCGKSTVLKLLCGIESVDKGQIYFNHQDITHLTPAKRDIHLVFQHYALFPHMNVYDNVAFGLRFKRKLCETLIRKEVHDILDLFHISHLAHNWPRHLSGGEQQRVAIARAILPRPQMLALDEPMAALDRSLRLSMRKELMAIQKHFGITFLMVTHDQEEALFMSDKVCVMFDGKISQCDSPKVLYKQPLTKQIATFIGEMLFFKPRHSPEGTYLDDLYLGKDTIAKNKLVGIRPEEITFAPKAANADHRVVTNIKELGPLTQVTCEKPPFAPITLTVHDDFKAQVGDQVALLIKPNTPIRVYDEA